MRISIDNNLNDVKNRLMKEGYEVYNFSDRVIADIYIYSEAVMGFSNIFDNIKADSHGSLVINAYGKTYDEIKYSIERRVYSPLFS